MKKHLGHVGKDKPHCTSFEHNSILHPINERSMPVFADKYGITTHMLRSDVPHWSWEILWPGCWGKITCIYYAHMKYSSATPNQRRPPIYSCNTKQVFQTLFKLRDLCKHFIQFVYKYFCIILNNIYMICFKHLANRIMIYSEYLLLIFLLYANSISAFSFSFL